MSAGVSLWQNRKNIQRLFFSENLLSSFYRITYFIDRNTFNVHANLKTFTSYCFTAQTSSEGSAFYKPISRLCSFTFHYIDYENPIIRAFICRDIPNPVS